MRAINIAAAIVAPIYEHEAEARAVIARQINDGAKLYSRDRDLPKRIPRCKWEGKSDLEIVLMLMSYVRGASNALLSGHWTGDLNRVIALQQALAAEEALVAERADIVRREVS